MIELNVWKVQNMKISSVNQSFQGRRDNVDMAINLDDANIRYLAAAKTASESSYKKDKRLSNALIYSSALAAGLVSAMYPAKQEAFLFSKRFRGLGNRVVRGAKTAGIWAAGLASIDLMNRGFKALRRNSETYRNFDEKHSVISSVAGIGAALGALNLVDRASDALGQLKAPQFLQRFAVRANKFLNNNETIKNAGEFIRGNIEVLPKSLKNIGRIALIWAPPALILSGVMNSMRASFKANKEYHQNYSELKDAQSVLAQARVRELSVKNDILMQNPQNSEEMELLDNPNAGLPKVVAE